MGKKSKNKKKQGPKTLSDPCPSLSTPPSLLPMPPSSPNSNSTPPSFDPSPSRFFSYPSTSWKNTTRPPIEPGRCATLHNILSQPELNETRVIIQQILSNGRVAVEITEMEGTSYEKKKVIAVKPENLEVQWGNIENSAEGLDTPRHWGLEEEECPICMDTIMNTTKNASILECCGGKICRQCFLKTQFTEQKDSCPLCRADTSDTSHEAAVKKVMKRANRGDANAMYNLGAYYDGGLYGVTKNEAMARVWYQRAAEAGESRAAHNLGCSYRDGDGGPVDNVQASKYFRMAAEKGHVQAATNLGISLMRGMGVETDLEEAKKWLNVGAKAGDELAVQQLQFMDMMKMMQGMGVSVNCVTHS